ncbi:MAG: SDR family oxidoreductase [Candidatus Doudnabacteria bacterium]|nr:SDR family oxidoreductase [Candidatus Doudnabacteria bacterium]
MDLKNKTIIVTGAARIGKFVVERLIAAGANLTVSYKTAKPDFGGENILYVQADLSDYKQAESLVSQTKQKFGSVEGLVHMASTYERVPWEKLSPETWDSSLDAIAKSAFLVSKYTADEMLRSNTEGKIVLISDWSVTTQPYKYYLPYNSAKAAIEGLTKSLAKELAPKISVNAVAPGPIIRPPDLSEADDKEVLANTPLARWGGGEEIAKAVMFLMDSDFTTGQILYIDGGRSIA